MRGFFFTRKRTGMQKEYRNTELKDYFQGSIPVFFFIRRGKVNAGKAGREGPLGGREREKGAKSERNAIPVSWSKASPGGAVNE